MNIQERYVSQEVLKYDMPAIEEAVELIEQYRVTDFYESKQVILDLWDIDTTSIYELVIAVFTAALTHEYLTYQAMVGLLNHKIKLTSELDRIKIIADIIGLVSKTDLIDIVSVRGEYHKIITNYLIDNIPEEEAHVTVTDRPQPVETNNVILGSSINRHDGELRLAHLNRMNQVALILDQEFIREYEEAPKKEPDTETKQIQWDYFKDNSLRKYLELGKNKFYLKHNYDFRGRTYAEGYYITTQGNSFKKAIVQLANPLMVEGT